MWNELKSSLGRAVGLDHDPSRPRQSTAGRILNIGGAVIGGGAGRAMQAGGRALNRRKWRDNARQASSSRADDYYGS
jgi:hypothetical protein